MGGKRGRERRVGGGRLRKAGEVEGRGAETEKGHIEKINLH